MKNVLQTYRVPVLATLIMVAALAFWAWQAWQDISLREQAMRRQFALGSSDSVLSTLGSLVRDGRLPVDQTRHVLENIVRFPPVRFVILRQGDQQLLAVGDIPANLILPPPDGHLIRDDMDVFSRKVNLKQGLPNWPRGLMRRHMGPHKNGFPMREDFDGPMEGPAEGGMDQHGPMGDLFDPDGPKPPASEPLDDRAPGEFAPPEPQARRAASAPASMPASNEACWTLTDEQVMILGLDVRMDRDPLVGPEKDLFLTVFVALLFVGATLIAWIMSIRSRLLAEQLKGERARHAYLEELGLAAAGLAHETKNPLGIISGIAQRIMSCPREPEESQVMLEHILDEVDKATARLGNFMAFARPRHAEKSSVDAHEVGLDVAAVLRPDFDASGVKLNVAGPSLRILADKEMLRQVLVNLLLNSLHASLAGACVALTIERLGPRAVIEVDDEGSGIAPELLPEIFKPYVTANPAGHGLGLAIVKRFVEEHGWTINVTSELGRGTTVRISGIMLAEAQAYRLE